jgi:hypothetical protein
MSTAESRFKSVVHMLLDAGQYPSPTRINKMLRVLDPNRRGRLNNINGRECAWREQVLISRGWRYVQRWATGYAVDLDHSSFTEWEADTYRTRRHSWERAS